MKGKNRICAIMHVEIWIGKLRRIYFGGIVKSDTSFPISSIMLFSRSESGNSCWTCRPSSRGYANGYAEVRKPFPRIPIWKEFRRRVFFIIILHGVYIRVCVEQNNCNFECLTFSHDSKGIERSASLWNCARRQLSERLCRNKWKKIFQMMPLIRFSLLVFIGNHGQKNVAS